MEPALASPVSSPPMAAGLAAPALELCGVGKRFGTFVALEDVTLTVRAGEVHCLLGENGAGKSTLCNVVFGVHRPDTGSVRLRGASFEPKTPAHALAAGVAMVHQHFSLVGNMTGLENLLLLPRKAAGSSRLRNLRDLQQSAAARDLRARVAALSAQFGLQASLDTPVEALAVGDRQRLEIVKCLLNDPVLLVLDEPTAVLPPAEVQSLLSICRNIAAHGCGVLLVTHKLAEIAAVADRTSVLRRGRLRETVDMGEADLDQLVQTMVGRELRPLATHAAPAPEAIAAERALLAPVLQVEELGWRDAHGAEKLHVSFSVAPGEIVGIAGVEGNGQSELAALLSGMLEPVAGRVRLAGVDVTAKSPPALTRLGLGCVPEDRHAVGCHLELSVAENLFLGQLGRFSRCGLLRRRRLVEAALPLMAAFDVRGVATARLAALSGGNQQKAVLARELSLDPLRLLLAAQPTRGLDVGAVEAVYAAFRAASRRGIGVLLISSELDEVLAVADRVLVLYRGRIVGEVLPGPEQHRSVGRLMSGQRLLEVQS
jgi:ABC-type uncharacterized transport system ATPase subunit